MENKGVKYHQCPIAQFANNFWEKFFTVLELIKRECLRVDLY